MSEIPGPPPAELDPHFTTPEASLIQQMQGIAEQTGIDASANPELFGRERAQNVVDDIGEVAVETTIGQVETLAEPVNQIADDLGGCALEGGEVEVIPDRSARYEVIDLRTGEKVRTLEGVEIDIHDEWAVESVSEQLDRVDTFLEGDEPWRLDEQEEPASTLEEFADRLPALSLAFLEDRIEKLAVKFGVTAERAREVIEEKLITAVATSPKSTDIFSHYTTADNVTNIIKSRGLLPKVRTGGIGYSGRALVSSGDSQDRDTILDGIRQNGHAGYVNTAELSQSMHSLLVHGSVYGSEQGGRSFILYKSMGEVIDEAPIVMQGQDQLGQTRLDELHKTSESSPDTEPNKIVGKSTGIEVRFSPRLQEKLDEIQTSFSSKDVCFLASTESPRASVNYLLSLDDAILTFKQQPAELAIVNLVAEKGEELSIGDRALSAARGVDTSDMSAVSTFMRARTASLSKFSELIKQSPEKSIEEIVKNNSSDETAAQTSLELIKILEEKHGGKFDEIFPPEPTNDDSDKVKAIEAWLTLLTRRLGSKPRAVIVYPYGTLTSPSVGAELEGLKKENSSRVFLPASRERVGFHQGDLLALMPKSTEPSW